jgi:diaminopimelate epimerase
MAILLSLPALLQAAMNIPFHKFHGTGNDFLLINGRDVHFDPKPELISKLCHRRFGIGADGLILIGEAEGFDFSMRYFNADGHESSMCGNGARCTVAFADYLSGKPRRSYRFQAYDGAHNGDVLSRSGHDWLIRVSMSDVAAPKSLPLGMFVDTGSPHLVRFTDSVTTVDVTGLGRLIRHHDDFKPGGTNVDFVTVREGSLMVRTYERGVEDETLSCGTGVTACALAYAAEYNIPSGKISIETPGGKLSVTYMRQGEGYSGIWLEGPAVRIYEGIAAV